MRLVGRVAAFSKQNFNSDIGIVLNIPDKLVNILDVSDARPNVNVVFTVKGTDWNVTAQLHNLLTQEDSRLVRMGVEDVWAVNPAKLPIHSSTPTGSPVVPLTNAPVKPITLKSAQQGVQVSLQTHVHAHPQCHQQQ
jgi:hypothetical protein